MLRICFKFIEIPWNTTWVKKGYPNKTDWLKKISSQREQHATQLVIDRWCLNRPFKKSWWGSVVIPNGPCKKYMLSRRNHQHPLVPDAGEGRFQRLECPNLENSSEEWAFGSREHQTNLWSASIFHNHFDLLGTAEENPRKNIFSERSLSKANDSIPLDISSESQTVFAAPHPSHLRVSPKLFPMLIELPSSCTRQRGDKATAFSQEALVEVDHFPDLQQSPTGDNLRPCWILVKFFTDLNNRPKQLMLWRKNIQVHLWPPTIHWISFWFIPILRFPFSIRTQKQFAAGLRTTRLLSSPPFVVRWHLFQDLCHQHSPQPTSSQAESAGHYSALKLQNTLVHGIMLSKSDKNARIRKDSNIKQKIT